ncbi:synaptobrevin-1-like isoform X1 [Diprion similis]|uniref:synaptobrevin-1-like isoform X1 n=2 Tax=Diprion similis TaxID=362088 RepID=UPI001EF957D8|nr:synaptobrevin-1-like isoform X1 [Diprion similis]
MCLCKRHVIHLLNVGLKKIVHCQRNMDGGGYSGEGDLGGPRTPQQASTTKKMQDTQAKVDEVVGIMKVNVEKVLERDQKLSELDNRADALQQGAAQFEQQAGKLKRKYWWKNLKMMIIIGIIAVLILIIIIASLIPSSSSDTKPSGN